VRETEILVEHQPPQGVFVCDHAGRVINGFSQESARGASAPPLARKRIGAPYTLKPFTLKPYTLKPFTLKPYTLKPYSLKP